MRAQRPLSMVCNEERFIYRGLQPREAVLAGVVNDPDTTGADGYPLCCDGVKGASILHDETMTQAGDRGVDRLDPGAVIHVD